MNSQITRVLLLGKSRTFTDNVIERLTDPSFQVVAVGHEVNQARDLTVRYYPQILVFDGPGTDQVTTEGLKSLEKELRIPVLQVWDWRDRDLKQEINLALQRYHLEQEFHRTSKWYSIALSSINEGIIATNGKGIIRYVNPTACELTGVSREEALNRKFEDVFTVHGEDRIGRRLLEWPDGTRIPVEWTQRPHNGDNGGEVHIFRDISHRLLDESRTRIYQQKLKEEVSYGTAELTRIVELEEVLLEVSSDLIKLDEESFTDRLQNGLKRIGTALGIDSSCVYEIDPENPENFRPVSFWSAIESRVELVANNVIRHGDYPYWMGTMQEDGIYIIGDLSDLPLEAVPERKLMEFLGISGVATIPIGSISPIKWCISFTTVKSHRWKDYDVTLFKMVANVLKNVLERREYEAEQKKLEEQLNQAQKMEALGKLTGGIAHDFNNMLVPILGYAEELLRQSDSPPMEAVEIRRAAMSAAALTKQLLAFSRKQILIKKKFCLTDLLEEMKSFLQRILGEDIKLVTDLSREPDLIKADRSQLEQVIMNLCVNARDAMPEGGELHITTRTAKNQENLPILILKISDTGCGMDAETLKEIFEPFYSTKGSAGTGLGLAVALGVIEQHDGWVKVESEVGKGTTFSIGLPIAGRKQKKEKQPVKTTPRPQGNGTGQRILLVEDEAAVARFVKLTLEKGGYNITIARNRNEAVDEYKKSNGKFDLIFTDAKLPDGTGIEVLDYIFARNSTIPALISSGYSDDRALLDQAREKDVIFLHKPYTLEKLYEYVGKALTRRERNERKAEAEQVVALPG